MPNDIASFLLALTVCMLTMAVALPAVMGTVNAAARLAQVGIVLHATGWVLLLLSGMADAGSWQDRILSTFSMAGIAGGLAFNAWAFELWCGHSTQATAQALLALAMPIGYCIGFSNYAFRVGWANGLLALQMALMAAVLWRKPAVPVGKWRGLLIVSLFAQMLVTAWRGVLGAFFTASFPAFLSQHPVNWAFALVANVTAVLTLVGILLAHRDEAARALERLATIDDLTGVFNRRAWLAKVNAEFADDNPFAVLMIDLDHFKKINDSLGHEAGDLALRFFATEMQAAMRTGDLVGRYGGEEFCVFFNHADAAAPVAFDRRMREYLTMEAPRALGYQLSYSGGVATRSSPTDTLAAMLRRADTMLYSAKAQGRARTLDEQGVRLTNPPFAME